MLRELMRYTEVADKIIVDLFKEIDMALPQSEALFSHVLNAQEIWANRILGLPQRFETLAVHPKADFEEFHERNIARLYELLDSDLNKIVHYSNTQGEQFENITGDILLHVCNHSTYHRGQIVSQFKQNGITPPVTDLIILKREGKL